ncbi:MAG: M24 family metallopeptidase [Oceanococcus sp.]
MIQASYRPTEDDLQGFRAAQRLAYACAETIAQELQPGVTERQVAARMKSYLLDHGATDCFHEPFAWFGDRTAFRGLIGVKQLGGFNPAFYPGFRRLEENMPFILDCAPTLRGYTADVGYCHVLGQNDRLDQLMDDLLDFRILILDQVRQARPLAEISRAVDALCARYGYEPRHKAYPFETLAHRIETLDDDGKDSHLTIANFGVRNVTELVRDRIRGAREGWNPIWNSSEKSNHVPTPGLWAVEPHIGLGDVGAKWEELLVVTDSDAYWLDDDVPQVRRWKQRGLWPQQQAA